MDLRLVEYFVAVVDHGGITKAATALYIAQPSLSQAIRSLERQLGVTLFDRVGRQMVLTPAGIAFEVPARRVLQTTARARARVEAVRRLQAGRLSLAALSTLAVDPLPQLVSRLRRCHPGIQVHVSDPGGPVDIENAVRQGRAEIGLTELPTRSESLESRTLGTQRIALVLPPALAEHLPDPVPLEAVADLPLVLQSPAPSNRSAIDEAVERAAANVVVRSAHRQAVWQLVMAGAGATLLPRAIAEQELSGVVVRDTVPEIRRTTGLVFRPGPLSPAGCAFLQAAGVSPPSS